MNEMQNAHLLLTFARDFFKGSLKSSNKTYSYFYGKALASKKQTRIANCDKARYALSALRSHKYSSEDLKALLATDREQRAGNCHEYAVIALNQGVGLKIPNLWFASAENKFHTFIVLAEELPDSMHLKDFSHCVDNNAWVCDPWSNLACEMSEFYMECIEKAADWQVEGKEIYFHGNPTPAAHWVIRLFHTDVDFYRMTDNQGQQTDSYKELFFMG